MKSEDTFKHLQNRYLILRHGESEANQQGLIISNPAIGTMDYGLSEEGKKQVRLSVQKAQEKGWIDERTIIYSSDFKRTLETALIAQAVLQSKQLFPSEALRERYFGAFDQKSDKNYLRVWRQDEREPSLQEHGVETVSEVLNRVTTLIRDLERKYSKKTILLVSHGDTTHILQTAFEGKSPKNHRSVQSIGLGQLRWLTAQTQ